MFMATDVGLSPSTSQQDDCNATQRLSSLASLPRTCCLTCSLPSPPPPPSVRCLAARVRCACRPACSLAFSALHCTPAAAFASPDHHLQLLSPEAATRYESLSSGCETSTVGCACGHERQPFDSRFEPKCSCCLFVRRKGGKREAAASLEGDTAREEEEASGQEGRAAKR